MVCEGTKHGYSSSHSRNGSISYMARGNPGDCWFPMTVLRKDTKKQTFSLHLISFLATFFSSYDKNNLFQTVLLSNPPPILLFHIENNFYVELLFGLCLSCRSFCRFFFFFFCAHVSADI